VYLLTNNDPRCVYGSLYVCTPVCMCVRQYVCVYASLYASGCVYAVCMYLCIYPPVHLYVCVCVYTHICTMSNNMRVLLMSLVVNANIFISSHVSQTSQL